MALAMMISSAAFTASGGPACGGLASGAGPAVCTRPRPGPVRMIGSFFSRVMDSIMESQQIDYERLKNDESSFGGEAAEYALAGVVPTKSKRGYEVATFAGGCFWGTELHFQRIPGVISTCVGYTAGSSARPTYQEVCSGTSGHTEGVQMCFDPAVCSYQTLCEKLLSTVDPTALNRVGNDRGVSQKRSHGIYPHTDAQAAVARRCIAAEQGKHARPVVTEVQPAAVFWPAEPWHQRYLEKGGQSAAKDEQARVRCYG